MFSGFRCVMSVGFDVVGYFDGREVGCKDGVDVVGRRLGWDEGWVDGWIEG